MTNEYDLVYAKMLVEARREKAQAVQRLSDKHWMGKASDWSKESYQKMANQSVEEIARVKTQYLIYRGNSGHDVSAQKELLNLTGKAFKMPAGYFVMARKLIDDDGKSKWFTYYPEKVSGSPPYLGKTQDEVLRIWLRESYNKDAYEKNGNKIPDGVAIIPTSKVIYLDRY